ncbi:MAG: hypothetical protein WCX74_04455 [Candidatus Paceibacterota bacterium]
MLYYNKESEDIEEEMPEGVEDREDTPKETDPTKQEQEKEKEPTIYEKYSPQKIEQYKKQARQAYEEIMKIKKNQQESKEKKIITGIVQKWFDGKGYGFIEVPGEKRGVFCHINSTCRHLQEDGILEGEEVYISKIERTPKGTSASGVLCDECISPEEWVLIETRKSSLGIPEYKCEKASGSGYELEPTSAEKSRINQAYEEAEKDMNKWYKPFSSEFIETFGEPLDIEPVQEERKLVLRYPEPFGNKNIYASEAIKSGYFKVSFSEDVKEKDDEICIERRLDDFPEIYENISVVERCNSGFPKKAQEFKNIPTELQEKVIESLKDKLLPPEEIAKRDFEASCEDRGIKKIRSDINMLKAPGEIELVSRRERRTVEYSPSSDGYLPGGQYETEERRYYLKVGILKKNEIIDSIGVLKEFTVGWDVRKTAEEVRADLLEREEKNLQVQLYNISLRLNPKYFGNDRILDRDREEWEREYQKQLEKITEETKEKWEKEDEETAKKLRERYDNYIKTKEKLLEELENLLETVKNCNLRYVKKEYTFRIESAISEIKRNGNIEIAEKLIKKVLEEIEFWQKSSMETKKVEDTPVSEEPDGNTESRIIQEKKNETGIPDLLLENFRNDENRARRFMENVEKLDPSKIDEHILFECGRDRRRNHFIEISGNRDFFVDADPNQVCSYIAEYFGLTDYFRYLPERNKAEGEEGKEKDDNSREEDIEEDGGDIMAQLSQRFDVKVKKKK